MLVPYLVAFIFHKREPLLAFLSLDRFRGLGTGSRALRSCHTWRILIHARKHTYQLHVHVFKNHSLVDYSRPLTRRRSGAGCRRLDVESILADYSLNLDWLDGSLRKGMRIRKIRPNSKLPVLRLLWSCQWVVVIRVVVQRNERSINYTHGNTTTTWSV